MSTERDDLARIIAPYARQIDTNEDDIADAVLAAGYRKPAIVTTAEELDALPVGSVVLVLDPRCGDDNAWQLFNDVLDLRDEYGDPASEAWACPAYKDEKLSADLFALAQGATITVLHVGGES